MNRSATLLQRIVVLGCLVATPFLFIPEALNGFVLPKWFAIKLAALLLLVLSLLERHRRTTPLFAAPLDLPALLLFLAFGIAWTWSPGTWTGLETPSQLLALWVIYRAVAVQGLSQESRKVYAAALAPALLLSLVAVVLVVGGHDEASRSLKAALLGHGNYAGQWAILVTPIFAAFCLTANRFIGRALAAISLGLSLCYLLISNCRGAWVALVAATSIVVIAHRRWVARRIPRKRLLLLGVIAALAILVSWHTGFLKRRLTTTFGPADTGMQFRLLAWDSTLKMIANEPLWGVGSDSFAAHYPRYRSATERSLFPQRRFVRNPHNIYLLAAAEAGPLGLIAILALAITVLRMAVGTGGRLNRTEQTFHTALALGVVATLIHTTVSFNLERPTSALYFWVFAGMLSTQAGASHAPAGPSGRKRAIRTCLTLLAIVCLAMILFIDAKRIMASVHAPKGSNYKRSGNLLRAEKELKAALRLWPEAPNVCHILARVMLQKGDLQRCEELNRKALALWPFFRDALVDVGLVKWRQNKLEDAKMFMAMSLDVDPNFARGRIALGNLYAAHGEYPAAIAQYQHALKRRASREKARYYIAAVQAARGRPEEALALVAELLSVRHLFLDAQLRITMTADHVIAALGYGEKPFGVVVRDGDLWPVWQGKATGTINIDTSPPRIQVSAVPDGVAIRVSPDGERIEIQFKKAPDARDRVYSLAVGEPGVEKSFNLLADAEFRSQVFVLYGEILFSLDRTDEAKQVWREALRLDPENALAQERLDAR